MTEEEYYATCLDIVDEYLFKLEEGLKAKDACIIRHALVGLSSFLNGKIEKLNDVDAEIIFDKFIALLMSITKDGK